MFRWHAHDAGKGIGVWILVFKTAIYITKTVTKWEYLQYFETSFIMDYDDDSGKEKLIIIFIC